ncbi:MAG: hypothetical protein ACRDCN_10680 [Tannerellaceae bacterium]
MKKSIYYLLLMVAMVGITSCNSKTNSGQKEHASTTSAEVLTVGQLLMKAPLLIDEQVSVEGLCTHICKHGGTKIFLMGDSDKQIIRIEADKKLAKFSPETLNAVVRVNGKLVEERIDEAYLQNWEEEVKAEASKQHGEGGAGCATEQAARNEAPSNSVQQRIDNFRVQIKERNQKDGKNYLSFYHIVADSYEIID